MAKSLVYMGGILSMVVYGLVIVLLYPADLDEGQSGSVLPGALVCGMALVCAILFRKEHAWKIWLATGLFLEIVGTALVLVPELYDETYVSELSPVLCVTRAVAILLLGVLEMQLLYYALRHRWFRGIAERMCGSRNRSCGSESD